MSQFDEEGSPAVQALSNKRVGYCRPPEEHRFKKGTSGNPRGRPRKSPTYSGVAPSEVGNLIQKASRKSVRVTENGQVQNIKAAEALVLVAQAQALKGDMKALRFLLNFQSKIEERQRKERQKHFDNVVNYKRRWAKDMHRSAVMGHQPYIPVPHPDDIVIDEKNGVVIVNGPCDDVEKAEWDRSVTERRDLVENIEAVKQKLFHPGRSTTLRPSVKKSCQSQLATLIEKLDLLDAFYPATDIRRQPGFDLTRWRRERGRGRKCPT